MEKFKDVEMSPVEEVDSITVDGLAAIAEPPSPEPNLYVYPFDDPLKWPKNRRWLLTVTVLSTTIVYSISSSIYTSVIPNIAEEFGCSTVVSTLGIFTFLFAYAISPLLFAPLSEVFGRRPIFRLTLLLYVLFSLGCALAPNIAAMLALRFLAGFFGASSGTLHLALS